MENNRADILLIRKYLNGELDERAMYLLERRAQDDPELMDLMMGMELGNMQQDEENLRAIDLLIKDRVKVKETKRLIPWRNWSVAASAFLCISIASYLMLKKPQQSSIQNTVQQDQQVQNNVQQAPADQRKEEQSAEQKIALQKPVVVDSILASKTAEMLAANKKPVIVKSRIQNTNADQAVLSPDVINPNSAQPMAAVTIARIKPGVDSASESSGSLAEVTVIGRTRQARKEVLAATHVQVIDTATQRGLQGKVEGLQIGRDAAVAVKSILVTGIVTDVAGNVPLPGVSIKLKDAKSGTSTDVNGRFSIEVPQQNAALQVNMLGYEQKQVNVKTNQTALNIALTEDHQSLADVVVVSYGQAKKAKAQPLEGWPAYQKYLDQATASYHEKAKVSLSFNIDQQGMPVNIKVRKSSGKPALDEIATQIISTGPKWLRGSDPDKQLNLTIKF